MDRDLLLVPDEWWAVEGDGHRVELVDQRARERDAVLPAMVATLRLELARHEDALGPRCLRRRVDVVDQLVDMGAEGVDGKEAPDVEHHEARALRDAVPAGELRLAVLRRTEAAVGQHATHDLDQQPDTEALVPA